MFKKLMACLGLLLPLCACNSVASLVHDDQVVAKVGSQRLYKSKLDAFIPHGVTQEDSTNLALQYINSWATEVLYSNVASEQLSKAELDVSEELEAYRRSLIKFRYEQLYINERLDTTITEDNIEEFYRVHQDLFVLERPILKVRFLDIMKNADQKEAIVRKMSSKNPDEIVDAADMAFYSALRYFDNSDTWMDALILAREFGVDYGTMLSHKDGQFITLESADRGDVKIAYVLDMKSSGVAPIEFCVPRIKDYILSGRKHKLLQDLEQNLLTDALDRHQLVIY